MSPEAIEKMPVPPDIKTNEVQIGDDIQGLKNTI